MGTSHVHTETLPPLARTADAAPARALVASTSLLERVAFASLLLFIAALPLSRSVAEGGALVALMLWLAHRLRYRTETRHHALWIAAAAFFLLSAFSSIASLEPALSLSRMKTVALVMSAILVAEMVDSRRRLVACMAAFAVGSLVSLGLVAADYGYGIGLRVPAGTVTAAAGLRDGDIIQQVNGLPIRTPRALREATDGPGTARVEVARTELETPFLISVPTEHLRKLAATDLRVARPLRARGNLKHPPTYAFVLAMSSLLGLGVTLIAVERPGGRVVLALASLLAAAGVFLTVSRAAVAAMVLAAALAIWLATSSRILRLAAVIALGVLMLLAPLWFSATRNMDWLAQRDAGTNFRLLMWKDGVRLVLAHPLLGIGMDSAKERWQELGVAAYRRYGYHSHFHSAPLEIAAERGLPALVAWLAIVALALRSAWHAFRVGTDDKLLRGAALGVLSCLVAYLVLSFVYSTVGDATMAMTSWFIVGLAIAVGAPGAWRTPQGASA